LEEKLNDYSDKLDETEKLTINDFQKKSKYITYPDFVEKYNFITKDNILLR
jgi:hypothetical protein